MVCYVVAFLVFSQMSMSMCVQQEETILSHVYEASEDNSKTPKQIPKREQLALKKRFRHEVASTRHKHGKADSLMGLLSLTMRCRVYFWQSNERDALLTNNMTEQYG